MNVSVVMIVKNGSKTLKETLSALQRFDDVVVYDNGSTDGSQSIARSFSNVNLVEGVFDGFGTTKNRAANYALNDWILSLDCDEVVDKDLVDGLALMELESGVVYVANFKTYYKKKLIKHCGWNNQKLKRLYNKSVTKFSSSRVHEHIDCSGLEARDLPGNVHHYSYSSISDFIRKLDHYSTLFAENNAGKKRSSPLKAFFNASYSFFRTYFIKLGFLDGYAGLLIAFTHMSVNFFKYMKLYEMNCALKEAQRA